VDNDFGASLPYKKHQKQNKTNTTEKTTIKNSPKRHHIFV
jgi:hypothetical protein